MVYRKKATKKRNVRRRKANKVGFTMPQKLFRKLRYTGDVGTLSPDVSGVIDDAIISLNGMYDPEVVTSDFGNGQPHGFDQYMELYNTYCVVGAKVTCEFRNLDASNCQEVGIHVRSNTTSNTDPIRYIGQGSQHRILGPSGSSDAHTTMKLYFSTAKFFGKKKSDVLGEGDLEALSTANPSQQAYLHIWAHGIGTNTGNILCRLTVDYLVMFRRPKLLAES